MSKQELTKLAKGDWQREVINSLIKNGTINNPISDLAGKARNYSNGYKASLRNLFSRIEAAGYKITCTPGSRGGMWSATFTLD